MAIVVGREGNELLEFITGDESELAGNPCCKPLTFCVVVAKHKGRYLLVYDKGRAEWEVPGGMIDKGESPRRCAERELLEESNQTVPDLKFRGMMKFRLKPDGRIEYGMLYSGELLEFKDFQENDEIREIVLWDEKTDIGYINEVDIKLLDFY